jgi:methionine synthase II (cobalamin-independent)
VLLPLLDQLPSWTTTGVGSLPHPSADEAVAYLGLAYGLPFCPQLPRLDGDMVSEWLGPVDTRGAWSPAAGPRAEPVAWEALLGHLAREGDPHGVVKLQVTGPVTLACALERAGSAHRAVELGEWLVPFVERQVVAVRDLGLGAVLVLDEPALALCAAPGVEDAWSPLTDVADAWGLHLCCEVPWDVVDRVTPDLLSIDLAFTVVDDRAAGSLRSITERGGWIAWGAIAAHRPEYALHGVRRVTAALAAVPEAEGRSLLTPSCGTGLVALERERQVAVALRDVAGAMRRRRA